MRKNMQHYTTNQKSVQHDRTPLQQSRLIFPESTIEQISKQSMYITLVMHHLVHVR